MSSIPTPPILPSVLPPPLLPFKNAQKSKIEHHPFSDTIVWSNSTIEKANLPEEGSGGVIFVDFKNKIYPPVVVKGSSTVVQEIFALELAYLLKINTPKHYIVAFTQPEFSKIQYILAQKVGSRAAVVKKELNRPFLMVMEKINGNSIFSAVSNESDRSPKGVQEVVKKYLNNKENLQHIGKIMVLDVMLNNLDRIPLIWDNEGNLENLLFSNDGNGNHLVFAIDQAIYPVSKLLEKNYNAYLDKTRNLVKDITAKDWKLSPDSPLDKVKCSFKLWTGYDLTDSNIYAIRHGILETMQFVISNISKESLHDLKMKISKIGRIDWAGVFKTGMNAINLTFLEDLLEILQGNEKEITQALQENLLFMATEDCN